MRADSRGRFDFELPFISYTVLIFYSEEDEGYIAIVPELPGCTAFGETVEEALKEIKIAIELWIEASKKEGREMPEPVSKELLKEVMENTRANHG